MLFLDIILVVKESIYKFVKANILLRKKKLKMGGDMQKINLKVNGIQQQITASPDMVLIDFLREVLHLTGTKQSCDRKGQCGACTVIVNGKAARSCTTK